MLTTRAGEQLDFIDLMKNLLNSERGHRGST